MLGVYLFEDAYLKIVTITFSALIISEYLNILTEVTDCLAFQKSK